MYYFVHGFLDITGPPSWHIYTNIHIYIYIYIYKHVYIYIDISNYADSFISICTSGTNLTASLIFCSHHIQSIQ